MHAIDKHEGKKIIVVKTFKVKGPKKMIKLFFLPFSFLEVVPNGTTQGYFHHDVIDNICTLASTLQQG